MQFGYLSQVFSTFAWKSITSVEVNPDSSNGHEFNSSGALRKILGTTTRRRSAETGIPTRFIYFSDSDDEAIESNACMSWYDSRAKHATRTEWRLYYTDNVVIGREGRAAAGDFLVIAFSADRLTATVLVAESGSTSESQLRWLFGITEKISFRFGMAEVESAQMVDMTRARILEAAGVVLPADDISLLERMIELFGGTFPSTAAFGQFVRKEMSQIRPEEGADAAIMEWMEREEFAFRVLEKHIIGQRLQQGFNDVDEFVKCSLSIHNRRKSRAGHAFENHLGEIFRAYGLAFERGVVVENKAKPDFLFPGATQYVDAGFPVELLTLLGAKTSCKDRWRQVLAESSRVQDKHLVTLEPAISSNQLAQMRQHHLQLVIPIQLHATYPIAERGGLWGMATFIQFIQGKQASAGIAPDFNPKTTRTKLRGK